VVSNEFNISLIFVHVTNSFLMDFFLNFVKVSLFNIDFVICDSNVVLFKIEDFFSVVDFMFSNNNVMSSIGDLVFSNLDFMVCNFEFVHVFIQFVVDLIEVILNFFDFFISSM